MAAILRCRCLHPARLPAALALAGVVDDLEVLLPDRAAVLGLDRDAPLAGMPARLRDEAAEALAAAARDGHRHAVGGQVPALDRLPRLPVQHDLVGEARGREDP